MLSYTLSGQRTLSDKFTYRHICRALGVSERTYFDMFAIFEDIGLIIHDRTLSAKRCEKIKGANQIFHESKVIHKESKRA